MMCFYVLPNTMQRLFPLKLYTTSCCHLCDEAYALIKELELSDDVSLVEVSTDEKLLIHYGTRIPVLQRMSDLNELNWPFSKGDVIHFIKP